MNRKQKTIQKIRAAIEGGKRRRDRRQEKAQERAEKKATKKRRRADQVAQIPVSMRTALWPGGLSRFTDYQALQIIAEGGHAFRATDGVELLGIPVSVWTTPAAERMIHSARISRLLERGLLVERGLGRVEPTIRAFEALGMEARAPWLGLN